MLRLKYRLVFLLITLMCLTTGSPLFGADTFPAPRGAINDFAGVIAPEYKDRMERLAEEVLQKTGTSVVVATVKSIGDSDPADYANRLYEAWGIGKKGEDKGVLIFLALEERRIRIETGYGVEGILPDGLTGEILDRYVVPDLKKGDYSKGLLNAEAAVISIIARDAEVSITGMPSTTTRRTKPQSSPTSNLVTLILLFIIISFLLGTRQGRRMLPFILLMLMMGGRGGGGGGFGGFGGGGFGGFGGGMSGGGGAGRGF